jgi:predicted TIM-barrel fold metal-dependent hydrolase
MIIDCHGHYTTAPAAHTSWREAQLAAYDDGVSRPPYPRIPDDEIRETIEASQLRLMNDRGVDQLPQSPGVAPAGAVAELRRCVEELGFVGCNLNPDPSGGHWTSPPLTDPTWYPLYEAMVELDVPAMVLFKVVDTANILFGSEMVGAVRGIDPRTGHHFNDTRRYVDALELTSENREAVYEHNARRVYPRLDATLRKRE